MLLVGTGLLGLSAASVGFATEMWLARIAAFAFGAAGLGDMTATVLLAERGGERSGRLLAWGHGAFAIGAVATPVLAGVALEAGTSYPLLFAAAAVLNLSIFLWNALVPVPGEVRAAVSVPGLATGRESLFRQPLFLFGMVVIALYLGGEAALTIWLPTWILDRFGASEGIASASVAVFWVSMASARLGLGPVLERYDRRVVIVGMSGASALASVWLLVSASLVPAFIGVALAGLSMSLVVPLLQSAMAGAFPRSAVPVIGWLAVAAGTAGSVSPWVVGAMAETFQQRPDMSAGGGLTLALWLVPAAFGATAVAALRLRRP
jgi:fucose permease